MRLKLGSLIVLRWYAILGVFSILLFSLSFHIYPISKLSFYVALFMLSSNALLTLVARRVFESWIEFLIFGFIFLDLICLSLLLLFNGGAHNPFSILFIVLCAVAAMNLSLPYLLGILATSLIAIGIIYNPSLFHDMSHHAMGHDYGFHLKGMGFANALGLCVVSFWVWHLNRQKEQLAKKQEDAYRILSHLEKMDSMGRILASAAHQLNTPLATLQLGISELADEKNPLEDLEKRQWLRDLQRAIEQISHIFVVLRQEEKKESENLQKLEPEFSRSLETIVMRWASVRSCDVEFRSSVKNYFAAGAFLEEFIPCLEAVLENAMEARAEETSLKIGVDVEDRDDSLCVVVRDNGIGMDRATCERALEPLFTSKKTGTGLGLYICQQMTQKYSGVLSIESSLGRGTKIIMTFPKKIFYEKTFDR